MRNCTIGQSQQRWYSTSDSLNITNYLHGDFIKSGLAKLSRKAYNCRLTPYDIINWLVNTYFLQNMISDCRIKKPI